MAKTTDTTSNPAQTQGFTQLKPASGGGVMPAITYEGLQESHGTEAARVYEKIAKIAFGDIGSDFRGGRPALDIHSLQVVSEDDQNPETAAIAKEQMSQIQKLLSK